MENGVYYISGFDGQMSAPAFFDSPLRAVARWFRDEECWNCDEPARISRG